MLPCRSIFFLVCASAGLPLNALPSVKCTNCTLQDVTQSLFFLLVPDIFEWINMTSSCWRQVNAFRLNFSYWSMGKCQTQWLHMTRYHFTDSNVVASYSLHLHRNVYASVIFEASHIHMWEVVIFGLLDFEIWDMLPFSCCLDNCKMFVSELYKQWLHWF